MNFIKENLFIVLGVTLPIILIAFLSIVQTIQKSGIEPPVHKVAYLVTNQLYGITVKSSIDNKTKKLSVTLQSNNKNKLNNNASLTAYIYHPDMNGTPKAYEFDLPEIEKKGKYTLKMPKDLKNMQFINKKIAPDGYEYKQSSYRSGNLMTEIFGYNNRNRNDVIARKGFQIELPEAKRWNSTHFIGWVK